MKEEILEGVGAYTLKKTKVEKNKIDDEYSDEVQTIIYYDIMLNGKKVGEINWEDYFGYVQGTLHGKTIPREFGKPVGSDVQAWLHKFLKSKKGAKFAMQAEAKDCGCDSEANEEQEFMFAMKRKDKLKESLMAKAMKSLKQNLVVEAKLSAKKSKYGKYGLTAEGFDKIVNDVVRLISSHKKTGDITKIYEMLMKKKTNDAVKLIMPYVEDHATEYENEYSTDDNSFMITDTDIVELAKEVAAELADRMKKG